MGFYYGVLWVGSDFFSFCFSFYIYIYFRLFVGWIGSGWIWIGLDWIALPRLVHFYYIIFFSGRRRNREEGGGERRVALIESWIGVGVVFVFVVVVVVVYAWFITRRCFYFLKIVGEGFTVIARVSYYS